jgi:ribose transport system substrate-binding protein
MKRLVSVLLAVVVIFAVGSCARREKAAEVPRVAFVTNNVSDFWTIAKAGVTDGEKDFRVRCEFRMPAQGTATEQKQIVQDLLVKGVAGISISPIDPANQTDMLNNAAKSAHLITMDSDAPESNRLCYVGTDNYSAGVLAGEEMMKALPNGGKVVLFVGTLDAENARERRKGILDAVKGSKVQIIDTLTDNADHAKAKANVEDTLVKHPDAAGLMGLWSYNGPAIAGAVEAAGKKGKVKIVTFDEEAGTLQAVKDGTIFSTIVQRPYQFGYQSMRIIGTLAHGEDPKIPPSKIVDTGVEVINKDNVDAFWANLKKLTGKV